MALRIVPMAMLAPTLMATPNFIPASDPSMWYSGRTAVNADGTRSFDWEGVSVNVNVQKASYVQLVINTTGSTSKYTELLTYFNRRSGSV